MDERCRYIVKIVRNLELARRKKLKKDAFNQNERLALHIIRHNEGLTQFALTKGLNVDKALTSRIVKKLIKNELISKKVSDTDRRCYLLYATKKAEQFKSKDVSFEDEYLNKLYDVFLDAEKEVFLTLIEKIYQKSKAMRKMQNE